MRALISKINNKIGREEMAQLVKACSTEYKDLSWTVEPTWRWEGKTDFTWESWHMCLTHITRAQDKSANLKKIQNLSGIKYWFLFYVKFTESKRAGGILWGRAYLARNVPVSGWFSIWGTLGPEVSKKVKTTHVLRPSNSFLSSESEMISGPGPSWLCLTCLLGAAIAYWSWNHCPRQFLLSRKLNAGLIN